MLKNKTKFENYFNNNDKNLMNKWDHYFQIYERHFKKYKDKNIVLLEIGVSHGGSLQMWADYFGEDSKIYGVDIDSRCKEFENNKIKIFIGSQSDRGFLQELKNKIPKVDILIDDGGHFMDQQIILYEEMFDHINDDGIYLCEDIHTSYWLYFGGGYKRRGTFLEYSKHFIDMLNAYHSEEKGFRVNQFTETVNSIHYYDSILVIEKKKRKKPNSLVSGKVSFNNTEVLDYKPNMKPIQTNKILIFINKILRVFRLKSFKW